MKYFLISVLVIAVSFSSFAQSKKAVTEVLYFKAQLSCCQAKSCDKIEGEVKSIVDKAYPNTNVKFKTVQMENESSKPLIHKYKAKAMSLVIVSKSGKKENFIDASDVIRQYYRNGDKNALEKGIKEKIALATK